MQPACFVSKVSLSSLHLRGTNVCLSENRGVLCCSCVQPPPVGWY